MKREHFILKLAGYTKIQMGSFNWWYGIPPDTKDTIRTQVTIDHPLLHEIIKELKDEELDKFLFELWKITTKPAKEVSTMLAFDMILDGPITIQSMLTAKPDQIIDALYELKK